MCEFEKLEERLAHLYDIFYNKEKRPEYRKGVRKHILNLEEEIDRLRRKEREEYEKIGRAKEEA